MVTTLIIKKTSGRLTFLIYLTDTFRGGETTFYSVDDDHNEEEQKKKVAVGNAVAPKSGRLCMSPHGNAKNSPVHEGSRLFSSHSSKNDDDDDSSSSCKFVARTDVVFEEDKGERGKILAVVLKSF